MKTTKTQKAKKEPDGNKRARKQQLPAPSSMILRCL